jgi:hypothetical protein
MQKKRGRSEGVQVRLDPDLKREAKTYLVLTERTWQDLLEQCVRDFVATCRTQYEGQPRPNAKPFEVM